MNLIYLYCQITRHGFHQALIRQFEEKVKEQSYIGLIYETRQIHPGMGLRTMYEMLEPEGIGRDAFIALGLNAGYRLKTVLNYTRTTYSNVYTRYQNLLVDKEFTDVNQIWSSDLTYFYCLGVFYYIVLIMDVYSRRIIGYSLADNMRAENFAKALNLALSTRGITNYNSTLIHHSDKGSQYTSDLYTGMLTDHKIKISMCNEVYENTHIERLNDTIKNQYLERKNIEKPNQIPQALDDSIYAYNYLRPHQSLDKRTPVEFESNLTSVPLNKRTVLKIYTVSTLNENQNQNQLTLFT